MHSKGPTESLNVNCAGTSIYYTTQTHGQLSLASTTHQYLLLQVGPGTHLYQLEIPVSGVSIHCYLLLNRLNEGSLY